MFLSPLGIVAAEDSSSSGGAAIFQLFFFGLIFVAMYFLLIRPQRRRTREAQELNRALAVGDQVQTASGIVGFVTGFDPEDEAGDVAWIDIADGHGNERIEIRVMRSAVTRRINPQGTAAVAKDDEDDKK